MAVENLWTLGGKPASYNPLPIGFQLSNQLPLEIGEYVIRFTGSSSTLAVLGITSSDNTNLYVNNVQYAKDVNLGSSHTSYEFTVKIVKRLTLYLWDKNSAGNIIIQDIQLVRKPLPKPTINGVDGFSSGKWTLHANATVVSDEELRLNATGNYQASTLQFLVQSNTTYNWNIDHNGKIRISSLDSANTKTHIVYYSTLKSGSFTTNATAVKLEIELQNYDLGAGTFTFKRPQLVLGSQPVPYEKKKGDRMVLPQAKKNLIDGVLELGSFSLANGSNLTDNTTVRTGYLPVKPNTTYTISKNNTNWFAAFAYDSNKIGVGSYLFDVNTNIKTFTTSANVRFVRIRFQGDLQANQSLTVQLEESAFPTAYEPYAVSTSKRVIKKTPKLNLLPPFHAWTRHTNFVVNGDYDGTLNATGDGQGTVVTVDVKPNTTYHFSHEGNGRIRIGKNDTVSYNGVVWGTYITASSTPSTFTTDSTTTKVKVTVDSTTSGTFTFRNPSLVEGGVAKPFEPLEYRLRPRIGAAKPAIKVNGQNRDRKR